MQIPNCTIGRTHKPRLRRTSRGFTLIELLVVIAVISLLAGMLFPISKALNRTKVRTKIRAEMSTLEAAVDAYRAKLGTLPPDNPGSPAINQLYYELTGTVVTNAGGGARFYRTLDGFSQVSADAATFQTYFGPRVTGFMNSTRGAGDEGVFAVNFLKGALQPQQVSALPSGAKIIGSSVRWPEGHPYQPIPNLRGINPWRYNSSNPTNNPGSYDLWIDVIVDAKTNRFGNWSKDPIQVGTP